MLNLLKRKNTADDRAVEAVVSAHPVLDTRQRPADGPGQGRVMKFRYASGDQPLAGFTIKRGVGVGGFGEVYFATNDAGKEVALKQIQRNLEVEVRGVRQCLNLKHPNLISLYDIQFDADEQGWIVMEYVAGLGLRDALEAHPNGLPPQELERWFGQIVAGVAYLHDHGIVHRDLKPANIFEDQGIVKIGDYGLSKFISCSRRGGQTESVGTFHYMAPEIGKGEYGKEIDIYALGVMLYELATGVVPFDGESSQEIIMKHLTADPDLSLVASPIREVVARALAKNPNYRFSDVRDMVRPLGMEIDDRYLLVSTRATGLPPVVGAEPPRWDAHAQATAATAYHASGPQMWPFRNRHALPAHGTLHYQEPIARNIREGWLGLNQWWMNLSMNPGMKTALLVVAIIMLTLNVEILISLLVVGLLVYVPYYAIWWTLRGPQRAVRAAGVPPVYRPAPVPRPVVSPRPTPPVAARPMTVKQWRVARRVQLAKTPRRNVWSEITASWLGAASVIVVFSALVALFQVGSGQAVQPQLMGMAWAAVVALGMSWVAIGFGKRWQREEGDWAIRCFMQLTSGFAIGALAFALAEYLMIPWPSLTKASIGELPVQRWSGFFRADGQPLLPAYLAYFPLVMGLIHWWKQVDPLRRSRFSFLSVIWSVLAASLVHLIIPFPQPWGALVAAGASIAIQLSSPWVNPAERLQPTATQVV